jgi:hypothetical protein
MHLPKGVITFRPLHEDDIPLLHDWLQRPHVIDSFLCDGGNLGQGLGTRMVTAFAKSRRMRPNPAFNADPPRRGFDPAAGPVNLYR